MSSHANDVYIPSHIRSLFLLSVKIIRSIYEPTTNRTRKRGRHLDFLFSRYSPKINWRKSHNQMLSWTLDGPVIGNELVLPWTRRKRIECIFHFVRCAKDETDKTLCQRRYWQHRTVPDESGTTNTGTPAMSLSTGGTIGCRSDIIKAACLWNDISSISLLMNRWLGFGSA